MKKIGLAVIGAGFATMIAASAPAQAGEKMSLDQVPTAVRDTIKKQVADGKIDKIEKDTEDGRVVYEVDYKTREGKDFDLTIGQDGTLLEKEAD